MSFIELNECSHTGGQDMVITVSPTAIKFFEPAASYDAPIRCFVHISHDRILGVKEGYAEVRAMLTGNGGAFECSDPTCTVCHGESVKA